MNRGEGRVGCGGGGEGVRSMKDVESATRAEPSRAQGCYEVAGMLVWRSSDLNGLSIPWNTWTNVPSLWNNQFYQPGVVSRLEWIVFLWSSSSFVLRYSWFGFCSGVIRVRWATLECPWPSSWAVMWCPMPWGLCGKRGIALQGTTIKLTMSPRGGARMLFKCSLMSNRQWGQFTFRKYGLKKTY